MLKLKKTELILNPEEEKEEIATPIVKKKSLNTFGSRLYPQYPSVFSPQKPKKLVKASQPKCLDSAIEIVKDKLYFYSNRFSPDVPLYKEGLQDDDEPRYIILNIFSKLMRGLYNSALFVFCIIHSLILNIDQTLAYVGYNSDFGPVNIALVHRYCTQLHTLMGKHPGVRIMHHCSTHYQKQANACFLMCAYMVMHLNKSPELAMAYFDGKMDLVPFCDAGDESVTLKTFEVTILDCLKGLQKAFQSIGWYNPSKFDPNLYEKAYQVSEGDINWIIPGQIAAFSSPVSGSMLLTVKSQGGTKQEKVLQTLLSMGVKHIIRLNDLLYDESVFTDRGIQVHDMEFPDGSCPSFTIIERFIGIVQSAISKYQPIAVHCRAGLGRTGTLIACYIMNKYQKQFAEAKSVIGYLRLARPGSVIGVQQSFLVNNQEKIRKLQIKEALWQTKFSLPQDYQNIMADFYLFQNSLVQTQSTVKTIPTSAVVCETRDEIRNWYNQRRATLAKREEFKEIKNSQDVSEFQSPHYKKKEFEGTIFASPKIDNLNGNYKLQKENQNQIRPRTGKKLLSDYMSNLDKVLENSKNTKKIVQQQ